MYKLITAALLGAAAAPRERWCQGSKIPSVLNAPWPNGAEVASTGGFKAGEFGGEEFTLEDVKMFSEEMMMTAQTNLQGTLVGEVYKSKEDGIMRHFIFSDGDGLGEFFNAFADEGTGGVPIQTLFRYGEDGEEKMAPWIDLLAGKNPFVTFGKYKLGFTRATCRDDQQLTFTTIYRVSDPENRNALRCVAQANALGNYENDAGMDRYEVYEVDEDTIMVHSSFRDGASLISHLQRERPSYYDDAGASSLQIMARGDFSANILGLLSANLPEYSFIGEKNVYFGFDRETSSLEGNRMDCYAQNCDNDDDDDDDRN